MMPLSNQCVYNVFLLFHKTYEVKSNVWKSRTMIKGLANTFLFTGIYQHSNISKA